MNSIVLLVERESVWTPEIWAEAFGGKRVGLHQITIEDRREWLSIVRDDKLLEEFDEAERSRLRQMLVEPVAYLVEWNGAGLVEQMLVSVPSNICVAVDNDHGLLTSVHQIAGKPLESWVKAASLP